MQVKDKFRNNETTKKKMIMKMKMLLHMKLFDILTSFPWKDFILIHLHNQHTITFKSLFL